MDKIGKAIRNEFMEIYARELTDHITVKALCAAVPVARTTFYARYRNVDDVLDEVEDGLLSGLAEVTERISGGDLPTMDFGPFLDETLGFIKANWTDFHALLVDQPDLRFIAKWKDAIKANLRVATLRRPLQPRQDLRHLPAAREPTVAAGVGLPHRASQRPVPSRYRLGACHEPQGRFR